ncbi:hypothetical protein L7F22_069241 [Adiantum nelumboides]|nr:hypothetical protein [Adiantum nelumboides]
MGTFGMSNVSSTTFSASTVDVAAISNMKANAAEKLKEKQQCLKAIKISLDQSKTKRDEQVGLLRGIAKVIERLNKDMEGLKLHKAGLVPNKETMAKLETLIQIRKEALKDMGLDIEVHNLDNIGEEAAQFQCLFHGCEEALKDALKLLAPGEANMDEHVEKDPMEGIFGSPIDGIAHSQAGSSRKPNIDSMCGGCGDKNASQKQEGEDTLDQQKAKKRAKKRANVVGAQGDVSKQSAKVPLEPELAMNKDVEDAKKSSKKPIEKDTPVILSDEDADLLISDVCGEILGRRKKRSNTEERATPKKKAKVASKPPEPTPRVELVSDRRTHFLNEVIQELTKTHMILHKNSTPYHPQDNGQAESSNKILVKILKKIVQENHKDWDLKLDSAIWSFKTTFKVTIGITPFKLMYGLEAIVPMEFVVPSLRVSAQKISLALSVNHRCKYLMQVEEDRLVSSYISEIIHRRRQAWIAMNVMFKIFKVGDWVMLYNSRLGPFPGKLTLRYKGPYQIVEDLGQGTFVVADVFGTRVDKPVNGFRLKKFQGAEGSVVALFSPPSWLHKASCPPLLLLER